MCMEQWVTEWRLFNWVFFKTFYKKFFLEKCVCLRERKKHEDKVWKQMVVSFHHTTHNTRENSFPSSKNTGFSLFFSPSLCLLCSFMHTTEPFPLLLLTAMLLLLPPSNYELANLRSTINIYPSCLLSICPFSRYFFPQGSFLIFYSHTYEIHIDNIRILK